MKIPEGICKYCKKSIAGSAMSRHLLTCTERKTTINDEAGNEKILLISAKSSPFWVYFEVNASDTLEKIDQFLRDLWLECCGHLSAFHINNLTYASVPEREYGDKSMSSALRETLMPNLSFTHEYDFGTTTELGLKCLSERIGSKLKQIEILARNNPPDFKCSCGKPAKEICTDCLWEKGEEAFLCKECAKSHECGDEMFLPVINSPRMGMCGYTG